MKKFVTILLLLLIGMTALPQETNIVILTADETASLRKVLQSDESARALYDSVLTKANKMLAVEPRPLKVIHYEGLLDTNPKRINTVKSFQDINTVATFIYAGYGSDDPKFGKKSKEIITAWVKKYEPTGNPINENKFTAFINMSQFNPEFNLYDFETENGASIKKSVEYVIPYATGDKQRKEWINTKVELDKKRAAAGIEKYQPGKLFDPKQAWEMFQWACYYKPEWYSIFEEENTPKYTSTWIGLLNSPLIRNRN